MGAPYAVAIIFQFVEIHRVTKLHLYPANRECSATAVFMYSLGRVFLGALDPFLSLLWFGHCGLAHVLVAELYCLN